ncbi:hypothetical protein TrLO_g12064 [Triparma laevis f. longispina]|uniref:OTU domain-containing protein n=1 Tax=Triparma laevis f. longispina TaxID=1714387 RepID=A0A9W7AHV5_9STRA|nr:hypothetical protein TrLO_g12064 [Triparma laevis f. longispina]
MSALSDANDKQKVLKALENERRAKVKKAKGAAGSNKKKQKEAAAAVEAVFDKKKAEIEANYASASAPPSDKDSSALASVMSSTAIADPEPEPKPEADPAAAKREKARLKKMKKKQKEQQEQAQIESDMANAGPSNREVESDAIISENKFRENNLEIMDVEADGHCLYRAIGHYLSKSHEEVRVLAAGFLESNSDSFTPFLSEEDGTFEEYVAKVRKSAEWGGELELRALSNGLKRRIKIYNSSKTPIMIGESFGEEDELKVSYHRYYYDLGEHYNVVRNKVGV